MAITDARHTLSTLQRLPTAGIYIPPTAHHPSLDL